MEDATLADLPRLVRVGDEVGWRGQLALSIAAMVGAYGVASWLFGSPLRTGDALLMALVAGVFGGGIAAFSSARRVRESVRATASPPAAAVYETTADSRDRRQRTTLLLVFVAASLLIVDRIVGGGGLIAGLMIGLFGAVGVVDIVEARRWDVLEKAIRSFLYILIPPRGLAGGYGNVELFEIPREQDAGAPADEGLEL